MEPTSEQELKQLLEEGKITEDEYHQLLEAIHQKEKPQPPIEKSAQVKPRTGYGRTALILFILSITLPIFSILLLIILSAMKVGMLLAAPFLLIGMLCALMAFIFGIIGWKSTQGKIAAIGVPCLGLLIVPGLLLLMLFSHRAVKVVAVEGKEYYLKPYQVYQLDSLDGVLKQDGLEFDSVISSDGKGSLKMTTGSLEKKTFRLLETGPVHVENRTLVYAAKLKSDLSSGRAYLEMWCDIPGKGEFFSRGLAQPISGTTQWTHAQIPFRLEAGQAPENVKLNLVVEGTGTVWIDDIKLLSNPLD
jgi:hypothetical protein